MEDGGGENGLPSASTRVSVRTGMCQWDPTVVGHLSWKPSPQPPARSEKGGLGREGALENSGSWGVGGGITPLLAPNSPHAETQHPSSNSGNWRHWPHSVSVTLGTEG